MTLRVSGLRRHLTYHGLTLVALAVATALAYPTWLSREPMALDDLQQLNAPQRSLLAWFYQHGHLPLWNPFNFGGQPFLAAGQSGPLYLPNLVFLLLPLPTAMKVSYLFHELLGSFGMYALLWQFTKNRLAAFAGAVAFITCGFFMGHEIHTQMFDAFTWLPVCFWLLQRVLDAPSLQRLCWLALAFAMEIYAGHPQITFYTCLLLGLYTVYYAMFLTVRQDWRVGGRALLFALFAFALGLGLSAAQWLPTLDLSSYSDRSNVTSAFLLQGTMPLNAFVQFLTPFTAGGGYTGTPFTQQAYTSLYHVNVYWEYLCYVSVIALTLATAVVISEFRRLPVAPILGGLALFFGVLAAGYRTFLVFVLVNVPGFDLFRVPARYTGLTDLLICILAAMALVELYRGNQHLRHVTAFVAGDYAAIAVVLRIAGPLRDIPAPAFWVMFYALVFVVLLCLPTPLMSSKSLHLRRWPAVILAVLVVADGMTHAVAMSSRVLLPTSNYTTESLTARFLQKQLQGSPQNPYPFARFAALDQSNLSQDRVLTQRIPSLNGEDSLVPQWYANSANLTWDDVTMLQQPLSLFNWLDVKYITTAPNDDLLPMLSYGKASWSGRIPQLQPGNDILQIAVSSAWTAVDMPIFSVTLHSGSQAMQQTINGPANGTYSIAIPPNWPHKTPTTVRIIDENRAQSITIQSLQVKGSTAQSPLDHIRTTLTPRAWKVVYKTSQVWVWENPNPLRAAWVTPDSRAPGLQSKDTTRLVKWSPNEQVWRVSGTTAGWFVLSQMYDPNWTAIVNGRPVSVSQLGNVLTGVPVPAGANTITLRYQPKSFRNGLWLTLFAIVAELVLVGASIKASRRRASR